MNLDCHNHVLPREAIDLLTADHAYQARVDGDLITGAGHSDFRNGLAIGPTFYDPEAKLVDLAERRIDGAVVSVAPSLFYYDLPLPVGAQMCDAVNEGLQRFCAHAADRLHWYAHIPMQHPAVAVEVLERAMGQGAVGVEVATSIAGTRLDGEAFAPFWAAAERLGAVVQLHPAYNEAHAALDDWYLQNPIGNLLETTIAVERLMCAGTFDLYPEVRLLLVHAGGFVPYQLGRLAHAARVRGELDDVRDPWASLSCSWFDTITHDDVALAYLVSRVPNAHVVLGTDLPFDMAPGDSVDQVERVLGPKAADDVLDGNARGLFGWTA